jgi:hypothetical protein
MSIRPLLLAACAASLFLAAPAGAVVGGEKIAPTDVPWFALSGVCGGTLVAPDRVLTAAHCVTGLTPDTFGAVSAGGQTRLVTHLAMHPDWRERNGENYVDDVALVAFDPPITGVTPVALGGVDPGLARIIGMGLPFAPGTGHSESEQYGGGLRQATLRTISDADCAKAFKGYHPADGERFHAATMRCAIDPDGKEPLSSGCNGDSGGPLVAGLDSAPVLLGVVSWGGDKCGADHLPSVFADVEHYRAFITDPSPTWMPTRHLGVKVAKHRCRVTGAREPGTTLSYVWKHVPHWGSPVVVGHGRSYRGKKSAKCFVYSSNDGGEILAGVNQR